jgi:predicted membrane chloride channel (bestrophin family)
MEVLQTVVTGIVGIIGVILGSQLSYRRSTKEKFWEARREAYSAILSKLAEIDRITKGADEWMATMGQGEYLGHRTRLHRR